MRSSRASRIISRCHAQSLTLEEIGPLVYNQAVADVQERLQARIAELDIESHEDEFTYWRKFDRLKKGK
jgi:hypothetical protein